MKPALSRSLLLILLEESSAVGMFLGISSSFNSLIEFSSNSALVTFETVSSGIDVSFSGFFYSTLPAGFSDMLEWRSAFLEQCDRNTKWPAAQIEIKFYFIDRSF